MQRLETERLILQAETADDFAATYALVSDIYPVEALPPLEALREEQIFYRLMMSGVYGGLFGRWMLVRKTDRVLVGFGLLLPHLCSAEESVALYPNDPARYGHRLFEVEIGWALGRPYRKLGYATEAAQALARYSFEVVNLPQLIACTDTTNAESLAIMRRLGMTLTPLLPTPAVIGWLKADTFGKLPL